MRIILIAALLIASVAAFAAPIVKDSNNVSVTLGLTPYGVVSVATPLACTSADEAAGAGTFAGSSAIDVDSNTSWTLDCAATVSLVNGAYTIVALQGINATAVGNQSKGGSMSDATNLLKVSGSFDIDDAAGAYAATTKVTLTY